MGDVAGKSLDVGDCTILVAEQPSGKADPHARLIRANQLGFKMIDATELVQARKKGATVVGPSVKLRDGVNDRDRLRFRVQSQQLQHRRICRKKAAFQSALKNAFGGAFEDRTILSLGDFDGCVSFGQFGGAFVDPTLEIAVGGKQGPGSPLPGIHHLIECPGGETQFIRSSCLGQ